MEHFKDNSGCSGPKKSEIFWNNSRKVQYVFAGVQVKLDVPKLLRCEIYLSCVDRENNNPKLYEKLLLKLWPRKVHIHALKIS